MWLGKHNPASFAALLARVLPIQANQKQEQEQKVTVRYETVEERRQAMIAKGWSPAVLDAMEAAMEPKFLREQKKKEELFLFEGVSWPPLSAFRRAQARCRPMALQVNCGSGSRVGCGTDY